MFMIVLEEGEKHPEFVLITILGRVRTLKLLVPFTFFPLQMLYFYQSGCVRNKYVNIIFSIDVNLRGVVSRKKAVSLNRCHKICQVFD